MAKIAATASAASMRGRLRPERWRGTVVIAVSIRRSSSVGTETAYRLRIRCSNDVSVGTVSLLQGMQGALDLLLGGRLADPQDAADLTGRQARGEAKLDGVPLRPWQGIDQ